MTTAREVFELAMHLMDETRESTGEVDTPETMGYKSRTVAILNTLCPECRPFSADYRPEEGGCPRIGGLEEVVGLDDGLCRGVLPYGLAAHLLLGEDDERAGFFQQRYEELLERAGRMMPARGDESELA